MTRERLQKYLARCGVASRRASEQIIVGGRVRVNGQLAAELGTSVDPERDTPQRLASYVKAFDPTFVGATGSKAAIDELAQRMGVLAAKRPLEGGNYSVDHTTSVFLIDPDGALRALFSAPHVPQSIADDYRRIAGA